MAKNKSWKKFIQVIFLIPLIFSLTGCIEDVELDEKVIVALVGIDKTPDDKLNVTMGVINTRSIEEKKPHGVEVYSSEGNSIFEAVRTSILTIGRQPQWPYIKVLVLGPDFKETDVVPILDFFNRNNEIQPNPYIAFTNEIAGDIVKLETELANIPAEIVESQFKHQNLVGFVPAIELHQFTEMMLTPNKVGIAAIIGKTKGKSGDVPKTDGTAVIKEGKWIGELSSIETRGMLWIRDEVKGGIITIPSFSGDGTIALEILEEGTTDIVPSLKDDQLSVKVHVEHLISVAEVMTYLDLDEKNLVKIKKATEKEIKREIENTIKKAKEWEVDIFNINRAVHKKYPKFWQTHQQNWDELFANVPIEVSVNVDVKTIGLLRSLPGDK